MQVRFMLIVLLIITSLSSYSQKKKKSVYRPITNTTLEESFPVAAYMMIENLKLGLSNFNYGEKIMTSTFYEYFRGINRYRARWQVALDDNGTMEIDIVDISMHSADEEWITAGEGLFLKREQKLRTEFADTLRVILERPEVLSEVKDWFFTNIEVTKEFYETATDLAGDRWFNAHLKNQEINWELTFVDIEKNGEASSAYQYKETYVRSAESALESMLVGNRFYITKYTNSDAHVLAAKGDKMEVQGFCRSLTYDMAKFYVVLTESADDVIPQTTLASQEDEQQASSVLEVADELKKLKELLDMGAITQEEYDKEKAAVLDR